MGKWYLHASSFIFNRIVITVAGNQNRHKSTDEFDLQVTRTCIKSRISSNFGQFGRLTTELAALERLKNFPYFTYNGKMVSPCSFIFNRIVITVAGNQNRHKSTDEFDFGLDQTTNFGVTCP